MRPDIEWQVSDGSDRQTVVKNPPPKSPSRWRWVTVAIVVVLGIGLGILYRSIPEPSPTTPTPVPTTMPSATPSPLAQLESVVGRDAQALADSDLSTLKELRDPRAAGWLNQTENSTWMHPPSGLLYRILDDGLLADGTAWVDVIQYRYGSYVRLTRFYTQTAGEHTWLRTFPDPGFWSGDLVVTQTEHFQIAYYSQDAAFIPPIAQHYEQVYQRLCSALARDSLSGSISATRAITLEIRPFDWTDPQWPIGPLQIHLPSHIVMESPRIIGLDYPSLAARTPDPNHWSIDTELYYTLANILTMQLAGWPMRLQTEHPGVLFIYAIINWTVNQQPPPNGLPPHPLTQRFDLDNLIHEGTEPLPEVWSSSGISSDEIAWSEAAVVIDFIDEQYGVDKVNQFLKAIGPSESMQQVIENGLGMSYADFEQQWQAWLKQQGVNVSN